MIILSSIVMTLELSSCKCKSTVQFLKPSIGITRLLKTRYFLKICSGANCNDRGLVVAQLSYFNCGGIAISMCISHKIGDGCNGYYLFHDWAEITSNPNGAKPSLCYLEQSIYPSPPSGPFASPVIESNKEDCVQRRYIFSPSKLRELKTYSAFKVKPKSKPSSCRALYLRAFLVKFPLHEIDFGWGKPIKVSLANGPFGKIIYLMGNQDGGLDVFVMLSQQDMSVLERDTQLLEFAYLVPSS
ncbi:hypothetical protein HAX54_016800 [Datura stramonium]|uniref:Uncharacterized protein n=1 Tax=Datura stramonium TaxID=4076 RepID=A0ABS8ULV6_DATST|nr:hypothetical protein [Datura stramonium]